MIELLSKLWNWWNSPELYYSLVNNRFILIVLVVMLMKLIRASYKSLWLSALINIPGTILHEILHLVVGGVMNAQPCNFSILPKRDISGAYIMGSVGFKNVRFYNAVPAALAPLLLLPLGFYVNRYLLPLIPMNLTNYILYVLLQTIIVENAIPSRTDWKVAGMYWRGIILYMVLLVAILMLF